MTNEEKIKKMTVGELLKKYTNWRADAEKLTDIIAAVAECGQCPVRKKCRTHNWSEEINCFDKIREWLFEEANK